MTVDDTQPFINHLIELRKRLLNCIISVVVVFLLLIYFANDIYYFIASPLIRRMPMGTSMIATEVTAPFFIPIKLTIIVSIFFSIPLILYQLWAFIAPALYLHERKLIIPLLLSSTFLFYMGMIFAYFIVLPLAFDFFTKTKPHGINIATDITHYLDFVISIFMAFGIAFEVPIAVVLLCWVGITTHKKLKNQRPYIFVGSFIIGMFLTPPDVLSQTLLAIPMYCLFEIGLFLSRFLLNKNIKKNKK